MQPLRGIFLSVSKETTSYDEASAKINTLEQAKQKLGEILDFVNESPDKDNLSIVYAISESGNHGITFGSSGQNDEVVVSLMSTLANLKAECESAMNVPLTLEQFVSLCWVSALGEENDSTN